MEPTAAAFIQQTARHIVISALSRTTAGAWIASEPAVAIPLDAPAEALGAFVLEALAASRPAVRHPVDWKARDEVLLRAVGETSIVRFNRGARALSATRAGEVLTLHPTKRGARRGTYVPAKELEVAIPADAGAEELGTAVRRALEDCEPW